MKTLSLAGNDIRDIPSFYEEINRVFMAGENWKLGASLDAFDDMLGGAYGAITGRESVRLIWEGMDENRRGLGRAATCSYLLEKLTRPDVFNVALISRQLAELEAGRGRTYFETVLEIIAGHPNIELIAA